MGKTLNKGFLIVPILMVLLALVIVDTLEKLPLYQSNGRVTLGQITDTYFASDQRNILYVYYVNGVPYESNSLAIKSYLNKKGQYFHLMYLETNPREHIILYKSEVNPPYDMNIDLTDDLNISKRQIIRGITGI